MTSTTNALPANALRVRIDTTLPIPAKEVLRFAEAAIDDFERTLSLKSNQIEVDFLGRGSTILQVIFTGSIALGSVGLFAKELNDYWNSKNGKVPEICATFRTSYGGKQIELYSSECEPIIIEIENISKQKGPIEKPDFGDPELLPSDQTQWSRPSKYPSRIMGVLEKNFGEASLISDSEVIQLALTPIQLEEIPESLPVEILLYEGEEVPVLGWNLIDRPHPFRGFLGEVPEKVYPDRFELIGHWQTSKEVVVHPLIVGPRTFFYEMRNQLGELPLDREVVIRASFKPRSSDTLLIFDWQELSQPSKARN